MGEAEENASGTRRVRLIQLRKQAGFTQDSLAEHLGVNRSTVLRWESGEKPPTPRLRPKLADALRLSAEELTFVLSVKGNLDSTGHERTTTDGRFNVTAESEGDSVNRREFIALAGTALAGAVITPPSAIRDLSLVLVGQDLPLDPRSDLTVAGLADGMARMKTAYQACNYQLVASELPELLTRARASAIYLAGDDRRHLAAVDAQLHHVAASVLLKLDNHALASVAADRSITSAKRSEDPVMIAASARIVTHTLMAAGQHQAAHGFATSQADLLREAVDTPDTDAFSVYGALLLRGAVAAGMDEDPHTARTLLNEAEKAALRLTGPANHHWTAFCLDNVHAHRLAVELLLGNAGTAIESLQRIELGNLGIDERKATVCIDAARAYAQWGKHDRAVNALLAAEQVSPAELRVRPAARDLVHQIRSGAPSSVRNDLQALVERVGIAA